MPTSREQAADTARNRRLNKLAGATVLGRELADARIAVSAVLQRHRRAQELARSPHAFPFDRKPSSTRADVRKAVAAVRDVEARIEARYGRAAPAALTPLHFVMKEAA